MKKTTLRLLSVLCALALVVGLVPALAAVPMGGTEVAETASTVEAAVPSGDSKSADAPAELAAAQTVWVVGDSTVCTYGANEDPNHFYKRCGYGARLQDYVSAPYEVQNLAISGESSKSFTTTANYTTLLNGMKANDILIIGFGHNDEKSDDAARYTAPNGTSTTEGSFAKSLADNYISPAKAKAVIPVLCTPIVRRTGTTGSWSNNCLHKANGGDYAEDIRKLGAELDVAVVDLTTLTKEKYDAVGAEETKSFHACKAGGANDVDNTHLNAYGAQVVAQLLATELAKLPNLAAYVAPEAVAPNKATHLVQNPDWVDPSTIPYAPPTTSSAQCQDYVAGDVHFKGTAIGELGGGDPTAANHVRETVDGAMHIAVKNNKSKITSSQDGLVMYYYQVPADKPFTLKAKARVNSIGTSAPNQAAFGLMARDDMYIDKYDSALTSDYVVAGCLGNGGGVNFARTNGTLNTSTGCTLAKPLAADQTYELQITRGDGNYSCAIDGVTKIYDLSVDNKDTQYTYIGMFCARSFDVTYSSIVLEVDGQTLCDTTAAGEPFSFSVKGWKFKDAKGAASAEAVDGGTLDAVDISTAGDAAQALAFAAVYDLDGRMTGVKAVDVKTGEIKTGLKMNGGETAKVFCLDKTGKAPLTEAAQITSGTPAPDPDVPVSPNRIKVWDFAAQGESDAKLYENMITASSWSGALTGGQIANGDKTFGDLVFAANSSEKLYSSVAGVGSYGDAKKYCVDFGDGYTSAGGIYCNGTGNASKRYVLVKDVKAGDKIVSYMGSSQNGEITFSAGTNGAADYTLTSAVGTYQKGEFIAKKDGDFKIWMSAGGGKPFYMRVMLLKSAQVKGTLTVPAGVTGYGLKFMNQTTGAETAATVTGNTFTAALAPGYTYTAVLTNATGYGLTNACKQVTVTDAESVNGKTGVALTAEAKSTYTYSGKVTGFAQGYDVSKLAVTLQPDEDSAAAGFMAVKLTLDSGLNYTATLEPTVVYAVEIAGVNDYEVTAGGSVTSEGAAVSQDITVSPKQTYATTGDFVTLSDGNVFGPLYEDYQYAPIEGTVTALTFENVDDKYVYPATVDGGSYTVSLRPGAYLAKATVNGWSTKTHVVVADKAVERDLFFVSTATPAGVAYAADLYVGDEGQTLNFGTITQALDYVKRMTRTDDQRVTIHIAPGTYREQLQIDSKNVTLESSVPGQEAKITWYYGIGYKYYSGSSESSTTSIYDVERAYDKFDKNIAGRWGATVWINADGFRAQDIAFENSFNYYLTDEELADGVACDTLAFERKYGAEVTSKAATERGAVIYTNTNNGKAGNSEFKDCSFLSSQDTLITGRNMYFTNCLIEGMTDYICGPGNAIFDGCELRFKGYHKDYANASTGGMVTAPQNSASEKGYVFRGCTITASPDANMTVGTGAFGRNWSATAGALFVDTRLQRADLISAAGWQDWSSTQLAKDANFREWNTTLMDGGVVSTTGRVQGTVLTAAPTVAMSDYFGSWVPSYYTAEAATLEFTKDPELTDNGDLNAPYPGHTLTVKYSLGANDANDVSTIQWYRVKTGAADVLVKTSAANVDRTYKIDKADQGCWIKAVVTPKTVGGKTAAAKSVQLADEAYVREGYENPDLPAGVPDLGEGVNLFLAGDSTVKDYSAKGMYNGGNAREEGSWGEFLQHYVDADVVNVVNYANGGRSARTFYNEGSLLKIQKDIKAGDYLFIQFGHNDCGGESYTDRSVPLGTPDGTGKYPTTAPTTGTAPSMDASGKITAGTYAMDSGGTYKWFLQQYIDVALEAGATPVLMTPVARMYYGSDGAITSHHNWGGVKGAGNTYCDAVKQLYEENVAAGNNVLFLDAYALTETMFDQAYTAGGSDVNGKQIMHVGDSTHCNKLGGMLEAALVAQGLQTLTDKDGKAISIAYTVKAPAGVRGETTKGVEVFTVNASGKLASVKSILDDYASDAAYWQTTGQTLFDAIAAKAAELVQPTP